MNREFTVKKCTRPYDRKDIEHNDNNYFKITLLYALSKILKYASWVICIMARDYDNEIKNELSRFSRLEE